MTTSIVAAIAANCHATGSAPLAMKSPKKPPYPSDATRQRSPVRAPMKYFSAQPAITE